MKAIYIFKTGDTFVHVKEKYGDFEDWIIQHISNPPFKIKTLDVTKADVFPDEKECLGVIITGSHAMVSDELEWSLKLEKYLVKLSQNEVPILGICYGHQLLGKAFGGISGDNVKGKEVGTMKITLVSKNDDALFSSVPASFFAHTTHTQTVQSLPKNAKSFATSFLDENHMVRFAKNVWGVQFHPEFDVPIMKEYIKAQKEVLEKEGKNVEKLLEEVKPTPYANNMINNFISIVQQKELVNES